jgi:hypothetical protein
VRRLQSILSDHHVPEGPTAIPEGTAIEVPPEVKAACVHTERYGTRWSGIVTVPARSDGVPTIRYADGSPCHGGFQKADASWPE